MDIRPYLEDLESRIDVDVEEQNLADWQMFCRGQWKQDAFAPRRAKTAPARLPWPEVRINAAFADPDLMILNQLIGCSAALTRGAGSLMAVRCNYGVPILAMPFGTELFMMADATNTLPNCHPLGTERMHQCIERCKPSLEHPYLQQVWSTGQKFMEIKKQYPKIGKYVFLYHPDFQGPLDLLELIWGSEIFTAFVDEPEVVHRGLRLITDFYKAAMTKWFSIAPPWDTEICCHWAMMHPGQIMLRDDSAMNLPPVYFEEFIRPYDEELLGAFGGGAIHSCGRVDHYVEQLPQMKGLTAFNMSQPEMNDMELVLRHTIDVGIFIIGLAPSAVANLQKQGRKLHGRVHYDAPQP